ncbi:hydrogenase nickel incorporation protein HypA/HybF [Tepidicella xavieri]|uniref:Hydrogenase maturation factor HypA n=2 Tax=Tepidicella xavieri TaxID=360241 RepID=A0A4R6U3A3_9BURK|nr:hydrogenase nickel incorporation protein HypA/HybF [Tepidicella xavieri]
MPPMHELALADEMVALIEAAARQQGFRRARVVRLEVGALACVEPQALQWAFEAASQGTCAEGAELVWLRVAAKGLCPACGQRQGLATLYDACMACGHLPMQVASGTELRVRDLDVE